MRVTWGVYVRPKTNRFVGPVIPPSEKILNVVAKEETIGILGAEAAQQLGLMAQDGHA